MEHRTNKREVNRMIKLTNKGQAIIKASIKDAGKNPKKITRAADQIADKIMDDILFIQYYNSTAKNNN